MGKEKAPVPAVPLRYLISGPQAARPPLPGPLPAGQSSPAPALAELGTLLAALALLSVIGLRMSAVLLSQATSNS